MRLDKPVRAVRIRQADAVVELRDGTILEADDVILTAPPSVWSKMSFAPALPTGLVDNKVCAIDETWSGLRFVLRVERRPKKAAPAAKPAKLVKAKRGAHH